MAHDIRTDALSDDEPTEVYRTPDLPDATIEALRELAIEEGDHRVAELASEALAPRMQPSAEAARRHRRQTRERCAQEWSIRAARTGIVLALVLTLAAACGVVEVDDLATGVVVHVEEVQTIAPPPAPPRLAIEVGGSVRDAVEVAFYQAVRVRVLAVGADGAATDVTEQATIATSDPLAVRVAGPGRLEAPPARGSATVTATLAGHEPAAPLAITVAPRHCLPVVDAVGPASVRIANPCTIPYAVDGWRLAHRGPAAEGPETTLATLAGELAPGEVRAVGPGPGGGPSGAVALVAVRPGLGSSVVDAVGYGATEAGHPLVEGAPAPAMTAAGLSRRGAWDSDDNAADLAVGGDQ